MVDVTVCVRPGWKLVTVCVAMPLQFAVMVRGTRISVSVCEMVSTIAGGLLSCFCLLLAWLTTYFLRAVSL